MGAQSPDFRAVLRCRPMLVTIIVLSLLLSKLDRRGSKLHFDTLPMEKEEAKSGIIALWSILRYSQPT